MKAMILNKPGELLQCVEVPRPNPGPNQLLIKVKACGICRTDLHIIDGDLGQPVLPLILGHQIVGEVVAAGKSTDQGLIGKRVGVPWLGRTCGQCRFCRDNHENLCIDPRFTGYQLNGGFAEYAVAHQEYCLPLPDGFSNIEAAPLLCAGLIGFRALQKAGKTRRLGLYGFGAAAHIIIQVALHENREVYAFTRPGDEKGQQFSLDLGACWAGGSDCAPPEPLDAAIIFAPAGHLVPLALQAVRPGGKVVCAGIHMTDIPSFPYHLLWGERTICSVANLTRDDGLKFFKIVHKVPLKILTELFPLQQANEALNRLRDGTLKGAAVLKI